MAFEKEFENLFRSFAELREQQAKTEKLIETLSIEASIRKEFKGIKVDFADRNVYRKKGSLVDEFDAVLWNGSSVIIVETKYKVHPSLIQKIIEKKIPNFKQLFSDKADHKIYYAIAGFAIPEKVIEEAQKAGFFIIKQFADSQNIIIENNEIKAY